MGTAEHLHRRCSWSDHPNMASRGSHLTGGVNTPLAPGHVFSLFFLFRCTMFYQVVAGFHDNIPIRSSAVSFNGTQTFVIVDMIALVPPCLHTNATEQSASYEELSPVSSLNETQSRRTSAQKSVFTEVRLLRCSSASESRRAKKS